MFRRQSLGTTVGAVAGAVVTSDRAQVTVAAQPESAVDATTVTAPVTPVLASTGFASRTIGAGALALLAPGLGLMLAGRPRRRI